MEGEVVPVLYIKAREGASTTLASMDAGGLGKGEGSRAHVSGGLVEVQAVVDLCWSLIVQCFIGVG